MRGGTSARMRERDLVSRPCVGRDQLLGLVGLLSLDQAVVQLGWWLACLGRIMWPTLGLGLVLLLLG